MKADDFEGLKKAVLEHRIDMVVAGPTAIASTSVPSSSSVGPYQRMRDIGNSTRRVRSQRRQHSYEVYGTKIANQSLIWPFMR